VPTGRSGVAAAVLGARVYLFGGEMFEPRSTFDAAERYDPAADRWVVLPPMPTARHGLGAAALDGRIHVISGGPQAGLTFSDVHEVLEPAD
jgi:N-acetylneuraminic acid mutarotase